MKVVLQLMMPGVPEPMLVLNNPPAVPSLGDLTIGPDGTVYQIMQRAFIVEQSTSKLEVVGAQKESRIVWQCVIVPVDMTDAEDPSAVN